MLFYLLSNLSKFQVVPSLIARRKNENFELKFGTWNLNFQTGSTELFAIKEKSFVSYQTLAKIIVMIGETIISEVKSK